MTNEEWRKANHDYLQKFLTNTAGDDSDITGSVKATMAQFLQSVKRQFNLIAIANDGVLTTEELIQSQIDQLRVCIIDLQAILNTKEGTQ
jgi:hypothetical protein